MKFESWEIKQTIVDDGAEIWERAYFYFRDSEGLLEGKSPTYTVGASDHHCLLEDAIAVAQRLENGENWEQVNKDFRQAW